MAALNYFVIDRTETGNRIYEYRKSMHLSRDGLADCLFRRGVEVSINSIGKWERGEVDISFDYAEALSKIFGCKLYGGLVVFHLREPEDERDQPTLFLFFVYCSSNKAIHFSEENIQSFNSYLFQQY